MHKINITIDGPSGSGKGVTSEQLARRLDYRTIDSGAIYRTIAFYLNKKGITPEKFKEEHIKDATIEINEQNHVFINGEDATPKIRTPEIGVLASKFADFLPVRELSNKIQRKAVEGGGYVLDGRDCGSVVLPNADLKIYLDASLEIRAQRRLKDHKDERIELDELKKQMQDRDERDKNKPYGALKVPDGAIIIDNSHMTIDQVVDEIYSLATDKVNES